MRKLATLMGLGVACLVYASDAQAQYSVTATARVVAPLEASAAPVRLEATPRGLQVVTSPTNAATSAVLRKAVVQRGAPARLVGRRWNAAPDQPLERRSVTAPDRADAVTVTRYVFANS